MIARLSRLCGEVFPGQADDSDFFGCWLVGASCLKSCGDDDAAELGGHVRGGRLGLGRVPGGAGAVIFGVGGVVPGGGVPAGGDGLAGELERDGPLDGAGGAAGACPAPKTCRASSIATSIDHLLAYRSITAAGLASRSVVTRARSYPVAETSRISSTCTRRGPKTPCHRQVMASAWMVAVFPYRVTVTGPKAARLIGVVALVAAVAGTMATGGLSRGCRAAQAARRRTSQTVAAMSRTDSASSQPPSIHWNGQNRLPGW